MRRAAAALAALAALLGVASCVPADPCAGRGDMLASEEGLVVTRDEHPAGWGESECLQCHALETTHRARCSEGASIDLQEVRDRAALGNDACADCHGTNAESGDVASRLHPPGCERPKGSGLDGRSHGVEGA